jgi:hypothetical protein
MRLRNSLISLALISGSVVVALICWVAHHPSQMAKVELETRDLMAPNHQQLGPKHSNLKIQTKLHDYEVCNSCCLDLLTVSHVSKFSGLLQMYSKRSKFLEFLNHYLSCSFSFFATVKCKKQCDKINQLCVSAPKDAPGASECKAYKNKCRNVICDSGKWKGDEYQVWIKKLLCFTGARDNYGKSHRLR